MSTRSLRSADGSRSRRSSGAHPFRSRGNRGHDSGERPWTAPRTPDGQPDIQGFWNNQGRRLATYDIEAAADRRCTCS